MCNYDCKQNKTIKQTEKNMKIKKTREKAHGTHRLPGLRSIRLFVYISIHIFYCVKQFGHNLTLMDYVVIELVHVSLSYTKEFLSI